MGNYKYCIGDRVHHNTYGYGTIIDRYRDRWDDIDEYCLEPFKTFDYHKHHWVSEYSIDELVARWDWITSSSEGYISGDKYIWDSRKGVWFRTDRK